MSHELRDHAAQMHDRADAYWGGAVASGRAVQASEAGARPPEPRGYRTVEGHDAVVTSIGTDGRLHGHVPGHFAATSWHRDGRHDRARNFDLDINRSLDQTATQDAAAGRHAEATAEPVPDSGLNP